MRLLPIDPESANVPSASTGPLAPEKLTALALHERQDNDLQFGPERSGQGGAPSTSTRPLTSKPLVMRTTTSPMSPMTLIG